MKHVPPICSHIVQAFIKHVKELSLSNTEHVISESAIQDTQVLICTRTDGCLLFNQVSILQGILETHADHCSKIGCLR